MTSQDRRVHQLELQLGSVESSEMILRTSTELQAFSDSLASIPASRTDNFLVYIALPLASTSSSSDDDADATAPAAIGRFFAQVLQIQHACHLPPLRSVSDAQPVTNLQVLILHESIMDATRLACLCSALPYAQSIHTLQLVGEVLRSEGRYGGRFPARRHPWVFRKLELSWLAYAIFHPRTKTSSSWRKLAFRNCEFGNDTMEMLELMRSNSLQSLARHHQQQMTAQLLDAMEQRVLRSNAGQLTPLSLLSATKLNKLMTPSAIKKKRKRTKPENEETKGPDGGEERDNGLWTARTKANVAVRVASNSKAVQLMTIQQEAELEICDPNTYDLWACVLVPGFGFGWVLKLNIVEIKPWFPLSGNSNPNSNIVPALTSLELYGNFSGTKTLLFLAGIGEPLDSLSAQLYPMPTGFLNKISLYCPSLKSLSLTSVYNEIGGQAIKAFFSQPTTQNLESLTLNWQNTKVQALQSVLSRADLYPTVKSLRELHLVEVVMSSHKGDLRQFADTVLRANQTLERVTFALSKQWQGPDRSIQDCIDWVRQYDGQPVEKEIGALERRWAFLSVVSGLAAKPSITTIRKLSRELIAVIFAFAMLRREVRVEDLSISSPRVVLEDY